MSEQSYFYVVGVVILSVIHILIIQPSKIFDSARRIWNFTYLKVRKVISAGFLSYVAEFFIEIMLGAFLIFKIPYQNSLGFSRVLMPISYVRFVLQIRPRSMLYGWRLLPVYSKFQFFFCPLFEELSGNLYVTTPRKLILYSFSPLCNENHIEIQLWTDKFSLEKGSSSSLTSTAYSAIH